MKAAKAKYPKIKRVKSVRSRGIAKDKIQQSIAQITTDGSIYTITICLYTRRIIQLKPVKFEYRYYSKIDMLTHLAHELAHVIDFVHTPEHKEIEAELTGMFMRMLGKEGYISEEDESKTLPDVP
jgi:hypothetical protein